MNLLVTNTRNAQAYGIIRNLRPYAKRIVATMYGPNRFVARLSHAANSRYVDRRYYVPSPVEDWRKGRIGKENTEREEEYIQAILRICRQEAIDVIFPSWEPKIYVFSKNKQRFKERKIVLPVPDYETLICAMDKYRLIKTARQVGFPCPKTFMLEDEDQLEAIEPEIDYPAIVKPRMSSGSRGFYVVRNRRELVARIASSGSSQGGTLVQEYVPGSPKRFTSFWIALDRNSRLIGSSLHRRVRTVFRDSSSQGCVWESFRDDDLVEAGVRLCRSLGIDGMINIQTKLDPRDGLHKLLEVNPRMGYNYWIPLALGLDTPLLALKVAKGEEVAPIPQRDGRVVFISPVVDAWAMGAYLIELLAAKVFGYRKGDTEHPLPSLAEFLRAYKDTYTASRKVFDPFFSDFFRDPLVSLTWWAAFAFFNLSIKIRQILPLPRAAKPVQEAKTAHEPPRHQHP